MDNKCIKIGLITQRPNKDPRKNIETIKDHVRQDPLVDLWLTSECFMMASPDQYQAYEMENCCDDLQRFVDDRHIAICLGSIREEKGNYYIHQHTFLPHAKPNVYDKCHLGKHEGKNFSQGNRLSYFDFQGFRFGIQICIETHINDLSIYHRKEGCQIILAPFNTPYDIDKRMKNWLKYLPARAYDYNMCFLATNRLGGALAIDGKGQVKKKTLSDEKPLIVEISSDDFNRRVDFFGYRREDLYKDS